jgi:hypothetical protein
VSRNLAYSFAEHCKLPSFADVPMKMHDVYHSCSGEYLRGSQYFPAMILSARPWLPMQLDTYNCGMGIIAAVATILRDVIGRNNQHHERYCNYFARYKLFIFEEEGEGADDKPEFFIDFPNTLHNNNLTGPLKKNNYLAELREEFFVFFDRLAKLYCTTNEERSSARPAELLSSDVAGYERTQALLKWPNNDNKRRDKAEKDSAASSLLKLLGTSGEADDEHGNNEADSSSASGESWDSDDSSDSSDDPNLVKEPRVPEEVKKGDDTDSLIGVEGPSGEADEVPEEVEKGDDTDTLIGVEGTQIESNEVTEPDNGGEKNGDFVTQDKESHHVEPDEESQVSSEPNGVENHRTNEKGHKRTLNGDLTASETGQDPYQQKKQKRGSSVVRDTIG